MVAFLFEVHVVGFHVFKFGRGLRYGSRQNMYNYALGYLARKATKRALGINKSSGVPKPKPNPAASRRVSLAELSVNFVSHDSGFDNSSRPPETLSCTKSR